MPQTPHHSPIEDSHGQDARDTRRPHPLLPLLCALCVLCGAISSSPAADAPKPQSMNGGPDDPYHFESLPGPEDSHGLEVGGMGWMPDGRLALCTRHGEVWLRSMETG